jgi:acyl-CoA hydrolase
MHSKGGMAIMALPSWHPKAHVSTIVRELREPATSFQHSFVVTEHGTAKIFGNDAVTQAAELVSVADPRARAQLSCNPALAGLIQLRSIV